MSNSVKQNKKIKIQEKSHYTFAWAHNKKNDGGAHIPSYNQLRFLQSKLGPFIWTTKMLPYFNIGQ